MPNIKLTKADDRGLSIPAHSVISIVGVENDPNQDWPTAKSLLRYDFGSGVCISWVNQSAQDIAAQVSEYDTTDRPWVEFSTPKGDAIFLLAHAIVAHEGRPLEEDVEGPQELTRIHFDDQAGSRRPSESTVRWAGVIDDEAEVARKIEVALNPAAEPEIVTPPKPSRKHAH